MIKTQIDHVKDASLTHEMLDLEKTEGVERVKIAKKYSTFAITDSFICEDYCTINSMKTIF
ncbi:MAG: hypothetical protein RBT65_00035 [Methanolobus sp.]|nr:hypothetical protein [Methanolobus sp.]